ncbi:MAG: peptidoglycan-binding protein [Bacteroidota bacterium]
MNSTINQKFLIYGGGFILVAGLSFWLYKTIKKKDQPFTVLPRKQASTNSGFSCKSSSYPLEYGTCHTDVKKLQSYLVSKGQNLGRSGSKGNGVDGQFGTLTQKAAKAQLGKVSFTKEEILKLS